MSEVVGNAVSRVRDAVASACLALGFTPDMMTVGGFVLTALAAICLVMGAGHAAPWEARLSPIQASRWHPSDVPPFWGCTPARAGRRVELDTAT